LECVVILYDNYHLSLSGAALLYMWAAGQVGYVNVVSQQEVLASSY